MTRVEVGRQGPAPRARAQVAQGRGERRAALVLANPRLVGHAERFPLDEPDPVAVLAGQLEPVGEARPQVRRRLGEPRRPLDELAVEDPAEEIFLVAEVVIEHALVHPRPPGAARDPRAREALCRELVESRGEGPVLRSLGIAGVARHGALRTGGRRHWGIGLILTLWG